MRAMFLLLLPLKKKSKPLCGSALKTWFQHLHFFLCYLALFSKMFAEFKWNLRRVLSQSKLHFLEDKWCVRNNLLALLWICCLLLGKLFTFLLLFLSCLATHHISSQLTNESNKKIIFNLAKKTTNKLLHYLNGSKANPHVSKWFV